MSVDDQRQERHTQAAAEAIGQWLMEAGILEKKIRHLSMDELKAIATAAVCGWIVARAQEKTSPETSSESDAGHFAA